VIDVARGKSSELEESIRRKRVAGLVGAVGRIVEEGDGSDVDDDLLNRLMASVEVV
jgi:DNA mismatch repair protein MSH3